MARKAGIMTSDSVSVLLLVIVCPQLEEFRTKKQQNEPRGTSSGSGKRDTSSGKVVPSVDLPTDGADNKERPIQEDDKTETTGRPDNQEESFDDAEGEFQTPTLSPSSSVTRGWGSGHGTPPLVAAAAAVWSQSSKEFLALAEAMLNEVRGEGNSGGQRGIQMSGITAKRVYQTKI